MKTIDVSQAEGQLRQLIGEVHNGGVVVVADGNKLVRLQRYDPCDPRVDFDLEEDGSELEAELLKAVEGPHAPYSHEEMRSIADRALRDHRERSKE